MTKINMHAKHQNRPSENNNNDDGNCDDWRNMPWNIVQRARMIDIRRNCHTWKFSYVEQCVLESVAIQYEINPAEVVFTID